ncbi:uncharacterized protein LOC113497969 [Trichoplusia ni]|uniref:Uncharacterized protein LOC113497969 n=1 Tax=Trichoplusia ni TaxID=7111 RepID=A0A7E5VZV0_TRINI|nr:uncharacterized protein LOC113497969 [Trichoplusia ni]
MDHLINKIIEKEGFIQYKIDKKCISTNGGNYLGELSEIDVQGKTKDGDKVLNIFVKKMNTGDEMKIISIPNAYMTELFFYKELSKIFHELQEEARVPLNKKYWTVKSYDESEKDLILMDNLSRKGFITPDRMDVVSLQFAEKAIQELAKFHAFSFILKEKRPEYFEKRIRTMKSPFKPGKDWDGFVQNILKTTIKFVDENLKERVENYSVNIEKKYLNYYEDKKTQRCLVHGIVNRGDSFRRRRSRSGSLAPSSPAQSAPESQERRPVACHRVAMVGAPGVGKTALISQFQTSECINAYDRQRGKDADGSEQKVSIMLNGEESEFHFLTGSPEKKEEIERAEPPDAFVVIYSVVDKASFQKSEQELARLLDCDMLRARPALLVGNKIDLARSRAVSTQDGKCLACTYKAKFIEVSVGINHNVDELLVGILTQIRLKRQQYSAEGGRESSPAHWYKSRGVVRASMKARQMFTWIFGKEDSKFKNCENLNVL